VKCMCSKALQIPNTSLLFFFFLEEVDVLNGLARRLGKHVVETILVFIKKKKRIDI